MIRKHHALPQNVHLLPKGARSRFACGIEKGSAPEASCFIRAGERTYLENFLRKGGGLCPSCERAILRRGAA